MADSGLLVTFAEDISEEVHARIVSFDKAIASASPLGLIEVVPALINVMVTFDPIVTDHVELEAALRVVLSNTKPHSQLTKSRTVKVCYDESLGFDLQAVAEASGLSEDAVINAHLAGDYKVLMYGFAPGYAYMTGVAAVIQVPRKLAAVRDIPAGCVMIAGAQCLVTTLKMPTGWSVIGQSPTKILIDEPDRPFLFDVGDQVSFERIDLKTYQQLNESS